MNKQIITGTVGDDHRVNQVNGTTKVARFPLATHAVYLDKEGNQVRKTEWHTVVFRKQGWPIPHSSKEFF